MTPNEQHDELNRILDRLNQAHEAMTTEDKPWWESKAIWGIVLMGIAQLVNAIGYDLPIDIAHWAESLASLGTLCGMALAWWGRIQATQPINKRRVLPGLTIP